MRALVLGHFSTVGDIECLEWVQDLLRDEKISFDVFPFKDEFLTAINGSLAWRRVDPGRYTHLLVVCGPLWPDLLRRRRVDLGRFAHCTRIGLNLTMVEPTETWNPFHFLLERDSDRTMRPDLTFLQPTAQVPVVGLCTIARQREYGAAQRHEAALDLLKRLIAERGLAAVEIDTRWPASRNRGGLGSPAQVMSVMKRVDVVLTNRLHGLVFALKAGVPALAVDPVAGGNKVMAQARVLGWPAATLVDEDAPSRLEAMLDWCLSPEGRALAGRVAGSARRELAPLTEELRKALHAPLPGAVHPPPRSHDLASGGANHPHEAGS